MLVAFTSWFQMRLEENERLEKLEFDELARAKGESALFEAKESEVFPARRSREQFEKFFVPGFAVLLFLLEAGGAWLLWRWIGKAATGIAPDRAMASLSLFAIFALLLFLVGRFSVTIARLENQRLLRPGASFLLAGAYVCAFTALGIAGVRTEFPRADFWVARGLCVLLGLMAVEILVTLLLEIYRPRVQGKVCPAALRQPRRRPARAAGKPVHHGGADAGLSIRIQGFRDVVFPVAQKEPARAAAGASGGPGPFDVRRFH